MKVQRKIPSSNSLGSAQSGRESPWLVYSRDGGGSGTTNGITDMIDALPTAIKHHGCVIIHPAPDFAFVMTRDRYLFFNSGNGKSVNDDDRGIGRTARCRIDTRYGRARR